MHLHDTLTRPSFGYAPAVAKSREDGDRMPQLRELVFERRRAVRVGMQGIQPDRAEDREIR